MTEHTPTFYWYDFETFGLDRRADRPAQFGGMRTDMNFEPIGKGDVFYAKPALDYLPNPESTMVTHITPQECDEKGMPESEFAGEIWARLNQPGTISLGYNTLRFDSEVVRFLFWRNFLDAYSLQWKNDCSRWDLFPVVCAVWSLRGNGIQWPLWKNWDPTKTEIADRVCFKLEALSKANALQHSHAHDALSDVEATIGLARLIQKTEPRFWQWALENRTKKAITAALEKGPVVWIDSKFGQEKGFIRIAAQLAVNTQNANEVFMWDLSHDPSILVGLSEADIRARLFVRRDSLPDGVEPLPVYRMSVNTSPFVCSNLRVVPADRAERYGLQLQTCVANFQKLQTIWSKLQGALMEFADNQEKPKASDVDYGLYDGGFATRNDEGMKARIRGSSPEKLAESRFSFDDERLSELLFRFRARNWPDTLTDAEMKAWKTFCHARVMEGRDGALTVNDYFEAIDNLQEGCWDDEEKQAVLEALYEWGECVGEACSDV